MKVRNIARAGLTLLLLLLVAESGLALTTEPNGPSEGANTTANSVANAPWFNVEVDTYGIDTGQFPSVAIDQSQGHVYVSYYDPTNRHLRWANYVGTDGNCGAKNDWHCQTVDSGFDVGKYDSLVARGGEIHVAYQDSASGDLRYALNFSAPLNYWQLFTVDKGILPSATGLYTSMERQVNGTRLISYYTSNPSGFDELKLAYYVTSGGNCGYGTAAGRWRCITIHVGEGMGQYTSLASDSDKRVHIAYYDAGNGDLWYATNSSANNCGPGNTWTCYQVSTLNDVGRYASMYVDNANNFHIAYYDATAHELKYAYRVSGGGNCGVWGSAQCDTIDGMPADNPPDRPVGISIAEDAAGYPIIAYQSANGSLNVARPVAALGLSIELGNCGPVSLLYHTWYCETTDRPSKWAIPPYRHGDFVSLATNSSGLATIAYYEYITGAGGNLGVSRQLLQVFMPLVVRSP